MLYTRCYVNGKIYSVKINDGHKANFVGILMVEKLDLITWKHLKPHELPWMNGYEKVR